MNILEELESLGAPPGVLEAGAILQHHLDAKAKPPVDLVQHVHKWYSKQQEQNRYGKSS